MKWDETVYRFHFEVFCITFKLKVSFTRLQKKKEIVMFTFACRKLL